MVRSMQEKFIQAEKSPKVKQEEEDEDLKMDTKEDFRSINLTPEKYAAMRKKSSCDNRASINLFNK